MVVNHFAAFVCIAASGDHRGNDHLTMVMAGRLRLAGIKMAIWGSAMAILILAGSATSRIGKANLATVHRFSPVG
jgi:hypothetical protein